MDSHPCLLVETRAGPVATLTLNRPAERNALSRALMAALQQALDRIAADQAVRVVVLAGAGPAFSAGHDLKELAARPDPGFVAALFDQCSRLMLRLLSLPQPVIARVHGIATAAGCQLVATADLAVAADGARFATPGVDIGLFCSTPMVALSRSVAAKPAMAMLLTGEPVDAAEALRIGLVNRVVPDSDLDAAVADLAGRLAAKPARVLAIGKEAFYRQRDLPLADAYGYASAVMTRNMAEPDAAEGIDAFLAKRAPRWRS